MLDDHELVVNDYRKDKGISLMERDDDYKYINEEGLFIPAIIFYIFAILWLISYFRLICTNIGVKRFPTAE